jgi:hypothetical protein
MSAAAHGTRNGRIGLHLEAVNVLMLRCPPKAGLEARTKGVAGDFWTILRGRPDCVGPAPQDEDGGKFVVMTEGVSWISAS